MKDTRSIDDLVKPHGERSPLLSQSSLRLGEDSFIRLPHLHHDEVVARSKGLVDRSEHWTLEIQEDRRGVRNGGQ